MTVLMFGLWGLLFRAVYLAGQQAGRDAMRRAVQPPPPPTGDHAAFLRAMGIRGDD